MAATDAAVFLILFLVVLGSLVSLVISSLINALWLMLANLWVRAADFGYGKAFQAVLLSQFVLGMLGLSVGLAVWANLVLAGGRGPDSVWRDLPFLLAPTVLFHYLAGSILVHALLFAQVIRDREGHALPFGKAAALAVVYLAILTTFALLVALGALAILANSALRAGR